MLMEKKPEIVVLGANPACQKTLFFDSFHAGRVNRAGRMSIFASGKGINFSRAARLWNRAEVLLLQFAGGETGKFIEQELASEGMRNITVQCRNATRTCTTCLSAADGVMTEVVEPSYPVEPEKCAEALAELDKHLKSAAALAVCGTLPGGTDNRLYADCGRLAAVNGRAVLLDAYINVQDLLLQKCRIYLKINAEELAALTGEKDIPGGLRRVRSEFGAVELAAITDGAGRAYLSGRSGEIYEYTLPALDRVVNPIGCGDTASAVWLSEMLCGVSPEESFRTALGAASANCLSEFCGNFSPADAENIAEKITYKKYSRC